MDVKIKYPIYGAEIKGEWDVKYFKNLKSLGSG